MEVKIDFSLWFVTKDNMCIAVLKILKTKTVNWRLFQTRKLSQIWYTNQSNEIIISLIPEQCVRCNIFCELLWHRILF